jgi:beta-galactosidase
LLLLCALAVCAPALPITAAPLGHAGTSPAHAKTFAIADGKFLLDGMPFTFISGEMHYARIPAAYWRQRLRMARACGLNAITTYVFWNIHEPEKAHFNFKGEADIARFIKIAQEEGLWVILRPGPYVCAEWDFGGFPYWLLNENDNKNENKNKTEKGIAIRSRDPRFMQYTARYLRELGKQLVPLQVTHGGNILLVQVENEYGSYSNDKVYMGQVRDAVVKAGFTVPLFTCDGGSQMPNGYLPGLLPGLNGGSGPEVKATIDLYYKGGPYMVPEYYPGWLDHWGEPKSKVGAAGVVRNTERMLDAGISFNYYMFHGGTNFGFSNGANFGGSYEPDITSYDYDAPLDEAGHATPKYLQIREAIQRHLPPGETLPTVPPDPPVVAVHRFALSDVGSLNGVLPKPAPSENLKTMEELGQDYGFILYRTTLHGPIAGKLAIKNVRDYAVVLLDGKRIGLLDRRRGARSLPIDVQAGSATLDILVENGGRINYGPLLTDNRKGITESVRLGDKTLTGWEIYSLPFKSVENLELDGKDTEGPTLRRGSFHVDQVADTFLDMRGWYKGVVWVNGHNLGRFWQIGPQQTLYVPGCWLKPGANEVVVLDLAPNGQSTVEGLTHAILDEQHAEEPIHKPRPAPPVLPTPTLAERVATGEFTQGDGPQDVTFGKRSGRYLCFQAIDSYDGDYASCAELYLLDAQGKPLPRDGWSIYYTDSEESREEDGSADNMIDDDTGTIWHSVWSEQHTPLPHMVVIDLGKETAFSGARYVARLGDKPGKTRKYVFYVSKTPFTTHSHEDGK